MVLVSTKHREMSGNGARISGEPSGTSPFQSKIRAARRQETNESFAAVPFFATNPTATVIGWRREARIPRTRPRATRAFVALQTLFVKERLLERAGIRRSGASRPDPSPRRPAIQRNLPDTDRAIFAGQSREHAEAENRRRQRKVYRRAGSGECGWLHWRSGNRKRLRLFAAKGPESIRLDLGGCRWTNGCGGREVLGMDSQTLNSRG